MHFGDTNQSHVAQEYHAAIENCNELKRRGGGLIGAALVGAAAGVFLYGGADTGTSAVKGAAWGVGIKLILNIMSYDACVNIKQYGEQHGIK